MASTNIFSFRNHLSIRHLVVGTVIAFTGFFASASGAQELDTYGGFTDVKGEKTGYFHTEKIDGRWWLVTPDGHGFFGIGISHPVTGWSEGAVTFAYKGSQEAWLRDGIRKMRELGFNCVWSGPYSTERVRIGYVNTELADRVYRESKIPHALHVSIVKHPVEVKGDEKRPDVFSNEYRRFVREEVAKRVRPNKDNPWIMGYYYGFGSFLRENIWLNDTLGRKPGSPGRERLISELEERYAGNIKPFNTVYKKQFKSFDDLRKSGSLVYPAWLGAVKSGASLPNTSGSDKILSDANALLGEIIEQVYKLAHTEIRKYDRNHLILGCYVKHTTYTKEIWKRVAPYIDALGPQDLSEINPVKPHVEATGLPAVLGDQVFGNVYPLTLQGTNGAFGAVPDHVDRNVLYELLANRIAVDPDFIGVSFCACLFDQSHWEKAYERGQPGFFTIDGEPRHDLCETVQSANARLLDSVRQPLDAKSIAELDSDYHETVRSYQRIMSKRKTLLEQQSANEER